MRTWIGTTLLVLAGCQPAAPTMVKPESAEAAKSTNTLKLDDESFVVEECRIWGYLVKRAEKWSCRWCISVECKERSFTYSFEGEEFIDTVRPAMEANTLPIAVDDWRNLDGVVVESGPDVDFEFLDPNDQRPLYAVFVGTHNKCSNNVIRITHVAGADFHISWTGNTYSLGDNASEDDPFQLDAAATFTDISLTSEIEDESDVDNDEIRRIFASVFPLDSFTQHPAKIERIEEDGKVYIDFTARFTPKLVEQE